MPADAAQLEARSPAHPAQKSTGKVRLLSLDRLDGRTIACRRARQLVEAIEADLGGADRLSEGERQLVQRAAVLGTYVESCEASWLAGHEVALGDYLSAINSQRRVFSTIGLKRVAKTVPTLAEHLARLAREHPAAPHDDDEIAPTDDTVALDARSADAGHEPECTHHED